MNARQKRFCEEYLVDCNATRAAIRAGYSPKTAYSIGEENLKKPELKTYIDERLERISSEKMANVQEIMEYLTAVMRGETKSSVLILSGDGYQSVIEKPPDEKERLKAAELLGKRYGLFTDKVNVESSADIRIIDDIVADVND